MIKVDGMKKGGGAEVIYDTCVKNRPCRKTLISLFEAYFAKAAKEDKRKIARLCYESDICKKGKVFTAMTENFKESGFLFCTKVKKKSWFGRKERTEEECFYNEKRGCTK